MTSNMIMAGEQGINFLMTVLECSDFGACYSWSPMLIGLSIQGALAPIVV